MQVLDDPVQEGPVGIEFDAPHPPVGDATEVRLQVAEQVDPGGDQRSAADRTLGGDQPQENGSPAPAQRIRSTW